MIVKKFHSVLGKDSIAFVISMNSFELFFFWHVVKQIESEQSNIGYFQFSKPIFEAKNLHNFPDTILSYKVAKKLFQGEDWDAKTYQILPDSK